MPLPDSPDLRAATSYQWSSKNCVPTITLPDFPEGPFSMPELYSEPIVHLVRNSYETPVDHDTGSSDFWLVTVDYPSCWGSDAFKELE